MWRSTAFNMEAIFPQEMGKGGGSLEPKKT